MRTSTRLIKDNWMLFLMDYQKVLKGAIVTTISALQTKHHIANFKHNILTINDDVIKDATLEDLVNKIMPALILNVRAHNAELILNPVGKRVPSTQMALDLQIEAVEKKVTRELSIKEKIDAIVEKYRKELYELHNIAS